MDLGEIIDHLLKYWSKTPKHTAGEILGSMTTQPHWLAIYAYNLFIHTNLADPVVFREIAFFEEDLVHDLSLLYRSEEPAGFITSGGTESNMIALYIARKMYGGSKNRVIVAPVTVHRSVDKGADILGLKLIKTPVTKNYRASINDLEDAIKKHNPLAIVLTAGTTDFGTIDPIREVNELACKYDIYLHIDAAYGGLLIPFLWSEYGLEKLEFMDCVSSISIDFHKNGLAPIPSGLILFRNKSIEKQAYFEIPYMPAKYQKGFLGTRPGASAAACWAVWKLLGPNGFRDIAKRVISLANYLYNSLCTLPNTEPLLKPILGIVSFRIRGYSADDVLPLFWRNRLFIYRTNLVDALRIAIMPHVRREHIDRLINFIEEL